VARAFADEVWWTDPSYLTTALPLLVVPLVSVLDRRRDDPMRRERFYAQLSVDGDLADAAGKSSMPVR
jgi:hypothetical protein